VAQAPRMVRDLPPLGRRMADWSSGWGDVERRRVAKRYGHSADRLFEAGQLGVIRHLWVKRQSSQC